MVATVRWWHGNRGRPLKWCALVRQPGGGAGRVDWIVVRYEVMVRVVMVVEVVLRMRIAKMIWIWFLIWVREVVRKIRSVVGSPVWATGWRGLLVLEVVGRGSFG